MDLADGLVTGSLYFHLHSPDLALSQGGSLHCSYSHLSESANLQQFSLQRKFILFLFRVAHMLPRQSVHYGHSQFLI